MRWIGAPQDGLFQDEVPWDRAPVADRFGPRDLAAEAGDITAFLASDEAVNE